MSGISGVTPVPVTVTHDPLGRALTEEQKARLREQLSAPVEETPHKERVDERRREGAPRRGPGKDGDDDEGPGQIIDSYA
jgi:hypothetical protein